MNAVGKNIMKLDKEFFAGMIKILQQQNEKDDGLKMKITANDFSYNYHGSESIDHNGHEYTRHNVDVYNVITINEQELQTVYQTACSWIGNDYNLPNPELELSIEGGTSQFLWDLERLCESDLDESNLEMLREDYGYDFLSSLDDLKTIYHFLNDNLPKISDYSGE